jgi:hypothetical protein
MMLPGRMSTPLILAMMPAFKDEKDPGTAAGSWRP